VRGSGSRGAEGVIQQAGGVDMRPPDLGGLEKQPQIGISMYPLLNPPSAQRIRIDRE